MSGQRIRLCSAWAAPHPPPPNNQAFGWGGGGRCGALVASKYGLKTHTVSNCGPFPWPIPHLGLYFHTLTAQPPLTGYENTTKDNGRETQGRGLCDNREAWTPFHPPAAHLLVSCTNSQCVCARGTHTYAAQRHCSQSEWGATVYEESKRALSMMAILPAKRNMEEKQFELLLSVCRRTPFGLRNSPVTRDLSSRLPLLATQGSLVFREVPRVTSHRG